MKSLSRFAVACGLAVLSAAVQVPAVFAQERIEVPWAELTVALDGKTVSTVLVDGTALKGRVLEVSGDELRFQTTETSNKGLHAKGESTLRKGEVSAFSYTERRGRWRALGTAIGVAAGAAPAILLCGRSDNACGGGYENSGTMATAAAAAVGAGGALGYLAGRAADKHETMVVVAKD